MNNVEEVSFEDLSQTDTKDYSTIKNIELLHNIPVRVTAKLGKTVLSVEEILKLDIDCIIQLNTNVGDPVEIYANNILIGYGEIVVVNDDIGIKIIETDIEEVIEEL